MVQRTVLKVDISCSKCKKKLIKSVSTVEGVDKIEVDEGKGTLTVTGNADPYDIIIRVRKTGKHAEVVTVGPPPAPPKTDNKKPDDKKPDGKKPDDKKSDQKDVVSYPLYGYPQYAQPQVVYVPMNRCYEPNPQCSIM